MSISPETISYVGCIEPGMMCCGLAEYDGLNRRDFNVKGAVAVIADNGKFDQGPSMREGESFCTVVMTQMYSSDDGKAKGCKNLRDFKAYVHRQKLGTVVEAKEKRNPNSGNMIVAALFTPNVRAMRDWMRKNNIESERYTFRDYW